MKPIRILMVLAGDATRASSRVRGYWIAESLEARGHAVTMRRPDSARHYLPLLGEVACHDAVIFQKTYGRYDVALARYCRLLGKRVLFDIDDAPSRTSSASTTARARRMMRLSDGVLAGSRALVELALQSQPASYLLPSGVRLANYRAHGASGQDPVCLGWIGNGAHYAEDLIDVLAEPMARLAARRPLRFRLVGACGIRRLYDVFGAIDGLTLDFIDRVDWASPDAVADAMAAFEIGLYPLKPGFFNDYKCAFKALEYMASSLPVVASAVGANAEIVLHERTGLLCSTAEDWEAALERLAADLDLRARFGAAGRAKVEESYDVSHLAMRLESIFTDDLENYA